jgi:small subunit ribosomal protein S14
MARESNVQRNLKRIRLAQSSHAKRMSLKEEARQLYASEEASFEDLMAMSAKLQKLKRDASPTRIRKRCKATGRPRGNNFTGFSRIVLRKMIAEGLVPGVTKSSW